MTTHWQSLASASFFHILKIRLKCYRLYHLHKAAPSPDTDKPSGLILSSSNTHQIGHKDWQKKHQKMLVTTNSFADGLLFFFQKEALYFIITVKVKQRDKQSAEEQH